MSNLKPTSHAEVVALFRHGILGTLTQTQLGEGQLQAALRQLSRQRFRPPGALSTRCYSVATLERWYYRYQRQGLEGLLPRPRSDKGRAQALAPELHQLLEDIRREHPAASVPLMLRTLEAEGWPQQASCPPPPCAACWPSEDCPAGPAEPCSTRPAPALAGAV